VVEDGRTLGAMSGCVKLFPVSEIALEEKRIRDKLTKYTKKGWALNRDDSSALAAIEQFYAGTLDEGSAIRECQRARKSNRLRAEARWRR